MKFNILVITVLLSVSGQAFANTMIGSGGGKIQNSEIPNQVYFIQENQANIEFATNSEGKEDFSLHSLRAEEIYNPMVLEALRRSFQSRKWEPVQKPLEMGRGERLDILGNTMIGSGGGGRIRSAPVQRSGF